MEYKYFSGTARYQDAIIEALERKDFERAAGLEKGMIKYYLHPELYDMKGLSPEETEIANKELHEIGLKQYKYLGDYQEDMEYGRYLYAEKEKKWKRLEEER